MACKIRHLSGKSKNEREIIRGRAAYRVVAKVGRNAVLRSINLLIDTMRNLIKPLLISLLAVLCTALAPAGTPPGGTEAKLDEFMTEYTKRFKAALAVKDDNQTLALLQKMKADLCPWANRLAPEVEAWEKNMSEAEQEAFRKRAENKPYVAELLTIGFNPDNISRIQKNPKLEAAMKDMENCINQVGKKKEATEEEASEEESGEDTDNGDNN